MNIDQDEKDIQAARAALLEGNENRFTPIEVFKSEIEESYNDEKK